MAKQQMSLKQLAIDKDSATILIVVGIAAFVTVFSLIASQSLWMQSRYQSRLITAKKQTLKDVKKSSSEVKILQEKYLDFAKSPQNALGGSVVGDGPLDGDNARIMLDSLPSKYDYPALTSSLEKVFRGTVIKTIEGTDDEVAQSAVAPSAAPPLIEMPFSITLAALSPQANPILQTYEKSIRPFQLKKLTIKSVEDIPDGIEVEVNAKTFVQGSKKFDVKEETFR